MGRSPGGSTCSKLGIDKHTPVSAKTQVNVPLRSDMVSVKVRGSVGGANGLRR